MSGPLTSLKKNKQGRVPLFPGHMLGNRPIPFRHPEYSEDESRLLEEVTSNMVQEKLRRSPFNGLAPLTSTVDTPRSFLDDADGEDVDAGIQMSSGGPVCPPPSDRELMRLMMNRVAQLEQQVVTHDQDMKVKDRQIKILEDKLRIAEKARQDSREGGSQAFRELETHCLLLQQQVHEMETFLAEYGMVWVGEHDNEGQDVYLNEDEEDEDEDGESSSDRRVIAGPDGIWRQDTSLAGNAGHQPQPPNTAQQQQQQQSAAAGIDFNVLIENIKDLNVLAGEGTRQIKKTSDGAKFEVAESVPLTIYANGLLMFEGPFRSYEEPSTKACVRDLLDGYFPSELQNRYPDGVPFSVTDLRSTHFQPRSNALAAFAGAGQTLGGEIKPSRLIPSNYVDPTASRVAASTDTAGLHTTSQPPGQPLTSTQFLNKLPKSVIRDGKVIDVRKSVGEVLGGQGQGQGSSSGAKSPTKPSVSVINTSVTRAMSASLQHHNGPATLTPGSASYRGQHSDVTTLRVVTETGDHTYIVKMKFSETLADLRTYLDTQRPRGGGRGSGNPAAPVPYDIVSTFPHKVHVNNTMTLEAAGLTPNAVIHLKPHRG